MIAFLTGEVVGLGHSAALTLLGCVSFTNFASPDCTQAHDCTDVLPPLRDGGIKVVPRCVLNPKSHQNLTRELTMKQ